MSIVPEQRQQPLQAKVGGDEHDRHVRHEDHEVYGEPGEYDGVVERLLQSANVKRRTPLHTLCQPYQSHLDGMTCEII